MAAKIEPTGHRVSRVLVGLAACSALGLALLSSTGCGFSGFSVDETSGANEGSSEVLRKVAAGQNAPVQEEAPVAETTLVETPYYTLEVPEGSLEEGWTSSFNDSLTGDEGRMGVQEEAPVAETTLVETPYYTLEVPEGSLEEGWTSSFNDSLTGDEGRMGGHRLDVFTPSSGDMPYISVVQYTGEWIGLQHDQGVATTSEAFSSEVDGAVWVTAVMGGPYGDYGPMTLEESQAFTQQWAQRVLPTE